MFEYRTIHRSSSGARTIRVGFSKQIPSLVRGLVGSRLAIRETLVQVLGQRNIAAMFRNRVGTGQSNDKARFEEIQYTILPCQRSKRGVSVRRVIVQQNDRLGMQWRKTTRTEFSIEFFARHPLNAAWVIIFWKPHPSLRCSSGEPRQGKQKDCKKIESIHLARHFLKRLAEPNRLLLFN
jgi:hypothetical protein